MSDLAVGEPCHGAFDAGCFWCPRCKARHPRDCLTETAMSLDRLEPYDFCECNEQPVEDEQASGICSACGKML